MVTFQELNDLRLGKLQAAVTDWQAMIDKLVKVADGGGGAVSAADMDRKAKAADWKGQNATVTKDFVTVTAREFGDVVTVARSVHTILSGAHSKPTKHKSNLADAESRAAKKNIYVNDKAMVDAAIPSPQAAGNAKQDHHRAAGTLQHPAEGPPERPQDPRTPRRPCSGRATPSASWSKPATRPW